MNLIYYHNHQRLGDLFQHGDNLLKTNKIVVQKISIMLILIKARKALIKKWKVNKPNNEKNLLLLTKKPQKINNQIHPDILNIMKAICATNNNNNWNQMIESKNLPEL